MAVIEAHKHTGFSAGVEQAGTHGVGTDNADDLVGRKADGDWRPAAPSVVRAEDVRCKIVEPLSVDRAYEYRADDAGDEEAGLMEHPAQQRRPRERQLRHRG